MQRRQRGEEFVEEVAELGARRAAQPAAGDVVGGDDAEVHEHDLQPGHLQASSCCNPPGGLQVVLDHGPEIGGLLTEIGRDFGDKLRRLTIAPLFGEAIHRIADESSVSSLFD